MGERGTCSEVEGTSGGAEAKVDEEVRLEAKKTRGANTHRQPRTPAARPSPPNRPAQRGIQTATAQLKQPGMRPMGNHARARDGNAPRSQEQVGPGHGPGCGPAIVGPRQDGEDEVHGAVFPPRKH